MSSCPSPMRLRCAENSLAKSVRMALLGLALFTVGTGQLTYAAEPSLLDNPASRAFSVPPGPLGRTLSTFAVSAGVPLSFEPALTEGLNSPGLSGNFSVRDALGRLLAGSGLETVRRTDGSYSLRKAATAGTPGAAGATTLGVVTVSANADRSGELSTAYAGGQVARGGRLGFLGNKDFMDTPFNITSFTSEGIQNQQARNIGDVVKNDASVRTVWPDGSYISQFTIRGFPTQTQDMAINGLYGIVPPQMTAGLEAIERVEILKGPSALLNGMAPSGGVGGNINLVTKRATDAPITQLTASYYSHAQFGTHVDFGRRFGTDNSWGIRFNGAYRDGKTGVDQQAQSAGSATVGLDYRGDRVRLSADLGYNTMHTDAPTRIAFTDNANFQISAAPRNTLSLGQPWYFAKSKDSFGMVQGEFDINQNLTVFAAAGARKNEFLGLYNFIYLQNAQGNFRANQYFQPTFSNTKTSLAGLKGKFNTGPVKHEVNFSVTGLHTDSGALAPVISTYTGNVYNPPVVAQQNLAAFSSTAPKTAESDLNTIALADTLHFMDDQVQLTLGARQQSVKVRNFNAVTGAQTSVYDQNKLTPAVALVVRPSRELTLYANYVEGLSQGPVAPAGTANVGAIFPPIQSKQYEAGLKYDFGRIAATVSAFRITQPNGITNPVNNVYGLNGEQRNEGIEFNTFGEVARGVRMLGGVTFMRGVLSKTAGGLQDGNKAIGVPTTQFNLGGEWDAAFMPGLSLTGRAIYTSSQYYNAANSQSIPSWTRIDIGARYKTRMSGTPVTFRAGIENLLDKDYWAAASSSFGLARGAPRAFLLSATWDF